MGFRDNCEWLGKVNVSPKKPIIAGSYGTWKIIYTVGKFGVDNGGRLKLVWKNASDWSVPQWTNPKADNYMTVDSTGDVSFKISYDPKGFYRPWLKAVTILVEQGSLIEGDVVTITLGDNTCGSCGIQAQTFAQNDFYFRLLVDCFESGTFRDIPNQPIVPVIGGDASRLKIIAPSEVAPGEQKRILVKAEDIWGNPAESYTGTVYLSSNSKIKKLPEECIFRASDKGVLHIYASFTEEGFYTIAGRDDKLNLEAKSNTIECSGMTGKKLYWCDFHGQTGSTLGVGTDCEYFNFAKNVAGIDVSAVQGNDFHLSEEGWKELKRAVAQYYAPGEFVTILGYEWSGNTPAGGDHNVYYFDESIPIHRSSHWHLEDKSDEENDRYPIKELYDELRDKDALIVPHIGGRRAILDYLTPEDMELVPVIEIASVHGRFEWFLHEAFDKGLMVGVVGNSDDHTCRPGASYPTKPSLNCKNGLTGIYAEGLNRESILEALKAKCCYATTGERIILKFFCDGYPMGSSINVDCLPIMDVEVVGTAPLEKVEILLGKEVVYSHPIKDKRDFKQDEIKILWGGADTTTRGRHTVWDGEIRIKNGKFIKVIPVAFDNPKQGIKQYNDSIVSWESSTSGDVDGLIIKFDAEDPVFTFNSKPVKFDFGLSDINDSAYIINAGGINRRVEISKVPNECGPTRIKFNYKVSEIKQGAINPYYVRVTQADGEMAWSSPIYIIGNREE